MALAIKKSNSSSSVAWDDYVLSHPSSTLYHLYRWSDIIRNAYGHEPYYLKALLGEDIVGVLPLLHLKSIIFGSSLVSLPFFDMGGILANDADIETALLDEALRIAQRLKADLDLRHHRPLSCANGDNAKLIERTHKVRMLLELPDSSANLLKSFKSKLRSQIKSCTKRGLKARLGGSEMVQDFYFVFCRNMRDLGSPVHSMSLIRNVLREFQATAKIAVVYKDNVPVAGGLVIPFKDVIENPWASALRRYSRLSPNMLLYWTMLEFACDSRSRYFDFGRSTPGEGTFKFKEQWGAKPDVLHWYYFSNRGANGPDDVQSAKLTKFNTAAEVWKRLPVPITRFVGPSIRKYISL